MEPRIYSVEITKESNAIVQIEAFSPSEAEEQARAMVKAKTVPWARKNVVTTNITAVKKKDD